MSTNHLRLLALMPWLIATSSADSLPHLFESDGSGPPNKLYWQTEPGVRYDLWKSDDLDDWQRVTGYPAEAEGLAMEYDITPSPTGKGFFKMIPIDEQPPSIVTRFPVVDGFAVGRFAELFIELEDATGINPSSISLTVGGSGQLGAGSPGLVLTGDTITYDSGDAALGGWGETITATLVVADTLGNVLNHSWSFQLEPEPLVAGNVFVFGSPTAQRAGQQVGATPTAALAARFPAQGPVRANDPPEWSIVSVLEDRIIIAYGEGGPPVFIPDQFLCNLTPSTLDEVFYRKLLSVTDAPLAKQLTLLTENLLLEDFIQRGSVSISTDTVVYETDGDGTIVRAYEREWETALDSIGPDLSGESLWSGGGATLSLSEARWQITPVIRAALQIEEFKLQRFDAGIVGEIRTSLVPRFDYSIGSSYSNTKELASKRKIVLLGYVGAVPVWLDLRFNLAAEVTANASVEAFMTAGARQNVDLGFSGSYKRGASPAVTWNRSITPYPLQTLPFTYEINGMAGAEIKLTPRIDILVFSMAGVQVNIDPRIGFNGEATVVDGELESAEWTLYSRADLNLGMVVSGLDEENLPSRSFPIYSSEWMVVYPEELEIKKHPQSASVEEGGNLTLEVVAVGPGGPENLKYQWYHKGLPIPGMTESFLSLVNVNQNKTGSYFVKVSADGETVVSDIAVVGLAPEGFALIPAGNFQMGDSLAEGDSGERPVHTVNVSAFYMAKHETTKALWDEVRAWGLNNGYTDLPIGGGKGATHPVHSVDWYSIVKWCNARSEKDGLTPCYNVGGAIYKTGNNDAVACDWNASGYRLPTEAEWEKAARGGLSGNRFPWGNTISHAQANYYAVGTIYGDLGEDAEYHPTYNDGASPYSSPVGSFAPNGYGLYDMTGNMFEWCWDWYGSSYYGLSPASDPRGPATGSGRVLRGGAWYDFVYFCRVAYRDDDYDPSLTDNGYGFRVARSSVPQ